MKMRYYILGIITMGMLLFGALSAPVFAQEPNEDPFSEGPPSGSYTIDFDINLVNNWFNSGPFVSTPSGFVNKNLYYNVTSMVSPLDEYFNTGFFMFGGEGTGGPEFAIDGTFEDSKLMVKVINDQTTTSGRLLDIQAAFMLGENITISWLLPEGTIPTEIESILPENFTLPAGSGTPPLPVIKTTGNFSQFESLNDWFYDFGYEGLPFFIPSVFFIDNLQDAYDWWSNEVSIRELFHVENSEYTNFTITGTPNLNTDFDLLIEFAAFNDTMNFGEITLDAIWGADGFLAYFSVELWADLDENGSYDVNEQFFIEFDLIGNTQENLPISVGDEGEYTLDIDVSASVDLDNDTLETTINELLTAILNSFNELDGYALLNYTVTSMDGLYYTLDGYMFDLSRFMRDRLPFFGEGTGAQEPPPPIEDYYMPILGPGGDNGYREVAMNLFDASVYTNSTSFWEVRRDTYYHDEYGNVWWEQLYAWDENSTKVPFTPGIVNAMVFEKNEWQMNYLWDQTFLENIQAMIDASLVVYNGPVEYREVEDNWYDPYYNEWHNDTYLETWIVDNSSPFLTYEPYIIVLEIQEMPGTGYTTYLPETSLWSMLYKMPMGAMGGLGAQDVIVAPMSLPIQPQALIPLPARTPDWDVVGGLPILMESLVDAMSGILTDSEFIAMMTGVTGEDPGDAMVMHSFSFGMDWIENTTHAGVTTFSNFEVTNTDNDTGNKVISEIYVDSYTEEHYLWDILGPLESVGSTTSLYLDISVEDWVEDTTIPLTGVETSTTTNESLPPELTPGFEVLAILTGLIAIPVFYKKRR